MPHINIKTLPGKTPEMKEQAAREIDELISRIFQVPAGNISISLDEVTNEDWDREVVIPELLNKKSHVLKFPEYDY